MGMILRTFTDSGFTAWRDIQGHVRPDRDAACHVISAFSRDKIAWIESLNIKQRMLIPSIRSGGSCVCRMRKGDEEMPGKEGGAIFN